MNIEFERHDNSTVVRVLEDRVDAANASELKTYLNEMIEQGNAILGIDLNMVSFIDSSGLGTLVSALKKVGQNGTISLWGLTQQVKTLFQITQLYEVFEIFEQESDAIEALNKYVAQ